MPEIAKIGEFALIDRLTKDIKDQNPSTLYGIGDDCAVLSYQDLTALYHLTAESLNTETLSIGIASVT